MLSILFLQRQACQIGVIPEVDSDSIFICADGDRRFRFLLKWTDRRELLLYYDADIFDISDC